MDNLITAILSMCIGLAAGVMLAFWITYDMMEARSEEQWRYCMGVGER